MSKTIPQIKIVNVETGEEIIRDANSEELAQMQKDATAQEAEKAASITKAFAKEAAQSKLAALGLTADDLKALGL